MRLRHWFIGVLCAALGHKSLIRIEDKVMTIRCARCGYSRVQLFPEARRS